MEQESDNQGSLPALSKRIARRLLTMGENRLQLLLVELQEERERLLRAILLALGVAILGLLAGITLTGAFVALFWSISPTAVLLAATTFYGATAALLYGRLMRLIRTWKNFPATLDQLRKDRACLGKGLI